MTALINQYRKTKNCYTGEIGNYGYAFVPGSSRGIVLLDLKTKNFLDNFVGLHDTKNIQKRLELLSKTASSKRLMKNLVILDSTEIKSKP